MKEKLLRICELQPKYSADNTPEMQERGVLIRQGLKGDIQALGGLLAPRLGTFGRDFHVDASDGIGRKTELPWVRFCSLSMSPSPTEGFYTVTHFSTDGSAVHVTVGCGSSRFHNGSAVPLPDKELDAQTGWARQVIYERFGTVAPFEDEPDFGARRPLPLSFQRATSISKRIAFEDIQETDFEELFSMAADRLRAIYEAQATGRDLSEADISELEISAVLSPAKAAGYRQGYGLSAAARRAVERRAMAVAGDWLKAEGYEVRDVSALSSFDLEARKGDELLKVEVKGTTSDRVDAILMTRNEVELHQRERGRTALLIVSSVRLSLEGDHHATAGGVVEPLMAWNIEEWDREPTAYRLVRQLG
jgi:hypothetical protein